MTISFKSSRYNFRSIYMNPTVTINKKKNYWYFIITQQASRKESKHTRKQNHKIIRKTERRINGITTKTPGKQIIK